MPYLLPNYTQIPNELLEVDMLDMGLAELKVTLAILRATFGFHRAQAPLSYAKLMEITGLAREAVAAGVKAAVARGRIERIKLKGEVYFRASISSETEPVKTDLSSETEPENPLISSETEPRIKERNTLNKRDSNQPTIQQEMFKAVAEITMSDPKLVATRIGQAASKLLKAGYSPERVAEFKKWWKANDFRGKKGQAPTLNQLITEIGRMNGLAEKPSYLEKPEGMDEDTWAQIQYVKLNKGKRADELRAELTKKGVDYERY